MSTLTQSAAWFRDEVDALGRIVTGAFHRIQAGRQAKADEFVRPYLAKFSKKELAEQGFGQAEIAKIKAGGDKVQTPYL